MPQEKTSQAGRDGVIAKPLPGAQGRGAAPVCPIAGQAPRLQTAQPAAPGGAAGGQDAGEEGPAAAVFRTRPAGADVVTPAAAPRRRAHEERDADWDAWLLAVVGTAACHRHGPGSACAMRNLVRVTSKPLLMTVRRIQRDAHEAEDVLQNVYLKLWLRVASFDPVRGSARQWLTSIAHNAAVDSLRRTSVTPGANPRASPGDEAGEVGGGDGLTCPLPDALQRMASERQRVAVQRSLRQLTAQRRDAVQLVFYAEMSHAELAAHLGRPLGTVKSMLRRSYAHLRPLLQAHV